VFGIAAELGNVRVACRAMGIHPSTYYRWKRQLDRYGPEILRPRERRVPRIANATSPLTEQRVVAFALGHPGVRAGADRRRVGQAQVGRDQLVDQWGVAGAAPPRPEHAGEAVWPGRRLHRPTPA
jgi:transposase-like protein